MTPSTRVETGERLAIENHARTFWRGIKGVHQSFDTDAALVRRTNLFISSAVRQKRAQPGAEGFVGAGT